VGNAILRDGSNIRVSTEVVQGLGAKLGRKAVQELGVPLSMYNRSLAAELALEPVDMRRLLNSRLQRDDVAAFLALLGGLDRLECDGTGKDGCDKRGEDGERGEAHRGR
jgi:hypothetical protein